MDYDYHYRDWHKKPAEQPAKTIIHNTAAFSIFYSYKVIMIFDNILKRIED